MNWDRSCLIFFDKLMKEKKKLMVKIGGGELQLLCTFPLACSSLGVEFFFFFSKNTFIIQREKQKLLPI